MNATAEMLTSREQEAFASDTAIMTIDEVLADTKLGKTTVYELMATGTFPKSFKLVGKKMVWLRSEIEHWKRWRIEVSKGDERWHPPAE
ncbi:helix-turn-helix transcriptional regulator [Roseibium album]|uniref:helix-turn-helix transcriptional regulator n=1 Tax=Roseibium album TaxID=311410 RepID=UPI002493C13C|nr:AlpA family phage regulatory protein [Roseibium album]